MFLLMALICFWLGFCGVLILEYTGYTTWASILGCVGWLICVGLSVWNGWLRWCITKEYENGDRETIHTR